MRKRSLTTPATLSALLVTICGQSAFAAWGGAPPKTGLWDPYAHPNGGKYAVVCTEVNYGGDCYTLSRDVPNDGLPWTCYDSELGFPNDKIKSAIVGKDVRLTLFWHNFASSDTGQPLLRRPGYHSTLGSWNGNASAARLVDLARAEDCSDVKAGELALFSDANYSGDCVILSRSAQLQPGGVLVFNRGYNMCFRNDTASSARNNSNGTVRLHRDIDFAGSYQRLQNTNYSSLNSNDTMSSVRFE